MPSSAHEVLVVTLREQPELLSTLLAALGRSPLPSDLTVADSALRMVDPVEVRPDLVLTSASGPWLLVEVQLEKDEAKRRKWPLMMSLMLDAHEVMGDIVVLTSSDSVAQWVDGFSRLQGPLGTALAVQPVVLSLTDKIINLLLDKNHPELGLFAAFAVRERQGPDAKGIAMHAAFLARELPEDRRQAQLRAILSVLGTTLRTWLEEVILNPHTLPKDDAFDAFWEKLMAKEAAERARIEKDRREAKEEGREEGETQGEAKSLLTVLAARGFTIDEQTRTRITACRDTATLERWITRAVTAPVLDAIFEE